MAAKLVVQSAEQLVDSLDAPSVVWLAAKLAVKSVAKLADQLADQLDATLVV